MIKNFTPHISCIFLAGLCSLLTACSDENNPDDGGFAPQLFNVTGKVEKGPFVSGSTITVQPMNADLQASGQMYASTIQDNAGNFSFGSKTFDTPYAELTANGYFFNEVEGSLSAGTLNLRALADLSDASTVNVNILTHLKYQRIANLMKEGQGFTEANRQSQEELMSAFGLQKYAGTDASRFSITAGNDEAGALIAVSSLLIVDRSEAELTEYLARLCQEFGKDGKFSDETLEEMKSDKARLTEKLSSIRENIISRYEELGTTVEVSEYITTGCETLGLCNTYHPWIQNRAITDFDTQARKKISAGYFEFTSFVPSAKELKKLADIRTVFKETLADLEEHYSHLSGQAPETSGCYWTSNEVDAENALAVNFDSGKVEAKNKESTCQMPTFFFYGSGSPVEPTEIYEKCGFKKEYFTPL